MYKFTVTESTTGNEVYVNLISSSAGRYLGRRPYVLGLIKEVMESLKLKGERLVIERDMGRNIGNTDIVSTNETDKIYYAQPIKTTTYSRFAKNRYPHPSNKLTIIVERDADGNYEIRDTWIGPSSPPFPGDEHETLESKAYWETHALAHDAQFIQTKSMTKNCPY